MALKEQILNYSFQTFQNKIQELSLPKFLATQIFEWIYKKHKLNFADMSNISQKNKTLLETLFEIMPWDQIEKRTSNDGLATKYIMTLKDGLKIECVLLHERTYNTLCISSQVGCPLKCKFCATGAMGFSRNLTAGEILGQILAVLQDGEPVSHVVFMGMGEPLLNLDAVLKAVEMMNSELGFTIGKRKITISTSGVLSAIQRIIKEKIPLNLAFSVGSPDPMRRKNLMPGETKNPILEVSKALHDYQKFHNRKITLEYTLIENKNDSEEEINELINLGKYLKAKINLIRFNPHAFSDFTSTPIAKMNAIREKIENMGLDVTIRYRKGEDIGAACGQLGGEN